MSREIKFRLRIQNKVVGYEKWYAGQWSENTGYWLSKPCWLYSKNGEYRNPEPIYHELKDTYTGLKDKNGKEIYEGDILSGLGGDAPYLVEWKHGGFTFVRFASECEVIGDIYSNPELLTA